MVLSSSCEKLLPQGNPCETLLPQGNRAVNRPRKPPPNPLAMIVVHCVQCTRTPHVRRSDRADPIQNVSHEYTGMHITISN